MQISPRKRPWECVGLLLCLALLSLTRAVAAGEEAIPEKSLFYPSRLQTAGGGYLQAARFAAAGVCASCHAGIFYQWSGSMHSRAHEDPLYMGLSRAASAETEGLTDRFCAGCHTPIAVAGGEVPPVGNPGMSRQGAEGVTCDFCHTVDRGTGTGNLPAVLDPGPLKRGPRTDSVSPFHQTVYLELATQAEFCGLCHDVSHPLNNLPIERTYSEWREGPYNSADPAQRIYCQDCHMRQAPGEPATGLAKRPKQRGKSAAMGPWREHVYSHYFVGGNATLTDTGGDPLHRDLAEERLKRAATLEILDAASEGGDLGFTVRVTNAGAGHYLPTGLTEVRQMWVETSLVSSEGTVLHRSGGLNNRGEIEPAEVVYHTVLGDAAGRPTPKVWQATTILSDHRIPPLQHDDLPQRIKIGRGWRGPLTIRARLLYRSYPPSVAELALGPGARPARTVEMAAAETTLELK